MRTFFYLFLFLCLSVRLHCQQISKSVIKVLNDEYDFNQIKEDGGMATCSFEFINLGSSLLSIKEINTSCGCTSPLWSKQPIAPDKKGFIKVQFDPKDHYGPFKETINVLSNAQDSDIVLTIKGIVIPGDTKDTLKYKVGDLSVKAEHINLGYIYKGKTATKTLKIANFTKKPMRIELTNLPSYLDALIYPSTIKPGGYGGIMIFFYSDKQDDWDYIIDRIGVVINGKKDNKAKIAISAIIREDFSNLTPELLALAPSAVFQSDTYNFGAISSKKVVSYNFTLLNKGKSNLIIHAVKPSCGCTAVKPEKSSIMPGDSTFIEVKFDPKEEKNAFSKSVIVITNDPKASKQNLWIKGNIVK
jgi:hypothetical protein